MKHLGNIFNEMSKAVAHAFHQKKRYPRFHRCGSHFVLLTFGRNNLLFFIIADGLHRQTQEFETSPMRYAMIFLPIVASVFFHCITFIH